LKNEYENYVLKPQNEIEHLAQEDDYGNVEYKLKLVHPNQERIEQLTTQMKFRLQEGNGEAKYVIGVEDDGTPKGLNQQEMYRSLSNLKEKFYFNNTRNSVWNGLGSQSRRCNSANEAWI